MKTILAFAGAILWLALFSSAQAAEPTFNVTETEDAIVITRGSSPVLTYHKAVVPPPEGADPAFARSGFIHPLHSPSGAVLTGIHPKDHFHHLGLWHAWVECEFDGEHVDFWNLKEKTGAIRYAKTLKTFTEKDGNGAGFIVEQEHVVFPGDDKKEAVVLREAFSVTARFDEDAYEIDYDTAQANVSKHALELPQYRYGGPIAYRAPHHWDQTNSDYLSSEGKTRIDGHMTRSKWCAFWGPRDDGHASLAILCHAENHDSPQRMRVWPPDTNNGAIFFNYVPIQETGWKIEPGQTSTMRYRLVVADDKPDVEDLDERWEKYAR